MCQGGKSALAGRTGGSSPTNSTLRGFLVLRVFPPAPGQEADCVSYPPTLHLQVSRPSSWNSPWHQPPGLQGSDQEIGLLKIYAGLSPHPRNPRTTHLMGPRFWNSSRITARALSSASLLISDFFFLQPLKQRVGRWGGVAANMTNSWTPSPDPHPLAKTHYLCSGDFYSLLLSGSLTVSSLSKICSSHQ